MKLRPRLYVIARPALAEGVEQFLRHEQTEWGRSNGSTDGEDLTEFSGRICYMSFGLHQSLKSNRDYIKNLIDKGHESVLEHATWTFVLVDVTRAFSHQLVRHRPGFAFSQLSQQYHDEIEAKFVEPDGVQLSSSAFAAWNHAMQTSKAAYRTIMTELDSKADKYSNAKETKRAIMSAARSVLPNATATKIAVSANARAIRHFLRVRGAIVGDLEMRLVAQLMLEMMKIEAPSLVADFTCSDVEDGSPIVLETKA